MSKITKKQYADHIGDTFPEGVDDARVVYEVIKRGLLPDVAGQMSDSLLRNTLLDRNMDMLKKEYNNFLDGENPQKLDLTHLKCEATFELAEHFYNLGKYDSKRR